MGEQRSIQAPKSRPPSGKSRAKVFLWARLPLLVIALGFVLAALCAERSTSPTTDEFLHVTRGVAWWRAPDTRLSWPHPPLGHIVTGAPAALMHEGTPFEEIRGFREADMPKVSVLYFRDYSRARAQLRAGRWAMIALTLLMLVYLYEWTLRRYGMRLASFVTLLLAANPAVLAHATVVTTDVPVTLVTLFSLLQLHDYLLTRSPWRLAGLALGIAGLVTAKLSGIAVALLLFLPGLVYAVRGIGRFTGLTRKRRAWILGRDAALIMLVALFAINAVYRFDDTGLTVAEISEHPTPPGRMLRHLNEDTSPILRALPDDVPIPLPYTYLYSVEFIRSHNATGHPSYFLGKLRGHGTPGYFPILLGAKLPTGMLVLLAAGLTLAVMRRFRGLPPNVWLHAYFAFAYLALTFNAHINIGVRHALPVVPSLAFLAAHGANALWDIGRWRRGIVVGCLVGVIVGTFLAYPRYMGDFNWLVGGRAGGHWISIIGEDWGQDLNDLAEWQNETGSTLSYYHWQPLRYQELDYLGAEVGRWSCRSPGPQDHWLALHVSERIRRRDCQRMFAEREPDLVLNDHIFLYRPWSEWLARRWPDEPGDEADQEGGQIDDPEDAKPEGDSQRSRETERGKHQGEEGLPNTDPGDRDR